MNGAKQLYLSLMKKALTYYIWGERYEPVESSVVLPFGTGFLRRMVEKHLAKRGLKIVRDYQYDPEKRANGLDWPPLADTMIGLKRLDNIQECLEKIIAENIHGDLIETGVWRGGGSIFMRAVLAAYGISDRKVWVADSFQGLPRPNGDKYPEDKGDIHHTIPFLAVSYEEVRGNFEKYGLLDDQVHFLRGWFKDTLPTAPIEKLSLMRLDGDMYESTTDSLAHLYPKLSPGGYVIVDDYVLPPCRKAVRDYREAHKITEEIIDIDGIGAFWRKRGEKAASASAHNHA